MSAGEIKNQHLRHGLIVALLLVAALGLSARIAYVHIAQSDFLQREGERHYKRNIALPARRGDILDRNGHALAVSAPAVSIAAAPRTLLANLPELDALSKKIGVDYDALKQKAERAAGGSFMYIKRQVSPRVARYVERSGFAALEVIYEQKRVYPQGAMFAQVVGITDIDGNGIDGAELAFNHRLQGQDGVRTVLHDRLRRNFDIIATPKQRVDGRDVVLSLDRNIQYIAYSELRRALRRHEASSGMLVVVDAGNGKVLSMVNYPTYNPNQRGLMPAFSMRNRVISDVFEPGSAIKPFIIAAALESQAVSAHEVFDVSPGHINIAGKTIRDEKNHGRLNVADILAKSSNVGMVRLAARVDGDHLAKKLRDYGLFSSPGIELRNESAGLFKTRPDWNRSYKDFLSFGYGASLSALQLAAGYAVLANGGVRKRLSVLQHSAGLPAERVMDPAVARQVARMLGRAVRPGGTGAAAATVAYRVAGKTGTTKKIKADDNKPDRYTAVFCGLAPADRAGIVIVVMIENPRGGGFHGGEVAAPVFSRVASRVLRYLDIAPDAPDADEAGDDFMLAKAVGMKAHGESER